MNRKTKYSFAGALAALCMFAPSFAQTTAASYTAPSAAAVAQLQHNTDSVLKANKTLIVKVGNSDLLVYKATDQPKPTLVYISSSNFFPFVVNSEFVAFPFNLNALGDQYNLVTLQKPGIPVGTDSLNNRYINETIEEGYYLNNNEQMPETFVAANYCDQYVNQYCQVIDMLKKQPWVDKEHIYLVGHGQGAEIAPLVAQQRPEVKKVALLSPGSLYNRFCEGIREIRAEETYRILNPEEAQRKIDSLYLNFNNLLLNRNEKNALFDVFSFNSFYSFAFPSMKEKIFNLKQKTLVVYGTHSLQDMDMDYLKLDLLMAGKANVDVFPYAGLDHNFLENTPNETGEIAANGFNWDRVLADVLIWLDK